MSIFDKFKSKEDLLTAVEAVIKENDNEFALEVEFPGEGREKELQSLLDKEISLKKKAQDRAKTVEGKIDELTRQLNEKTIYADEVDQLKSTEASFKEKLATYAKERTEFESRALKAEAALPELQTQLKSYQDRELDTRKRQELHDVAKGLNVWEAAIQDIQDFAPMFSYNDADELMAADGKTTARQWMAERLKTSPHWQAPSQGANTRNVAKGTIGGSKADVVEQAKKLVEGGNLREAIALQLQNQSEPE